MEFFSHQTSFPFMATRKWWYMLSAVLIAISLASFFTRGLNLAIDFTGGVSAQVTLTQPADVEAVRGRLTAAGFHEPQVQSFGSSHDIAIRLPPDAKLAPTEVRSRLEAALKGLDPGAQVVQLDVVGPQVGGELRESAVYALASTLVGIFLYIAFRFHTWRLSLGAILAVLHDPILVLGFFSITQTSFDLAVVAAILAVIGYSLNDTVIVFDRIRERARTARKLTIAQVIDESINQTLSRTLMTKLVTLLVVVALLIFGGETLRGFSAALVIGIVAGTYSSIYISSALALDIGLHTDDLLERKATKPEEIDGLP